MKKVSLFRRSLCSLPRTLCCGNPFFYLRDVPSQPEGQAPGKVVCFQRRIFRKEVPEMRQQGIMVLVPRCWDVGNPSLPAPCSSVLARKRRRSATGLRGTTHAAIGSQQVGVTRRCIGQRDLLCLLWMQYSQEQRGGHIICRVWHEPGIVGQASRWSGKTVKIQSKKIIVSLGQTLINLPATQKGGCPNFGGDIPISSNPGLCRLDLRWPKEKREQ